MISRPYMRTATSAATGLLLLTGLAGTAQADAASHASVRTTPAALTSAARGISCHVNWKTSTSANVWCDGHGPARYGASILCRKGSLDRQLNYNNGPWLGDRRGISMYCPGGGFRRVNQWGWYA
ncbi:hypothetical protein [Streptomyces sp. GS7]|uniref:hypothetical protein n=1 Tax=Streptomyces sp. GS7 TaxID=2692234 RepID=UPI0013197737|nr:hypothetical protein [Streptomyces sp. GS7]QHC23288.1 hypothetical protein GR130_19670 [Streptomyces sp. GS7]